MWEWFIPKSDRHNYYSPEIMEGCGGGGGPLEPKVIGWMWGFVLGVVFTFTAAAILVLLGKL